MGALGAVVAIPVPFVGPIFGAAAVRAMPISRPRKDLNALPILWP